VFAIAITLLVLDIKVPQITPPNGLDPNAQLQYISDQLPIVMGKLGPQLLAYFIGFLVLGLYWMSHHRRFVYIKRYDGRLIWLNMFLLMVIVFMPFPTALIGEYGTSWFPEVLYAVTVALAGILSGLEWLYATHNHRLVDPDLPAYVVKREAARSFVSTGIFLLSIPVAIWFNTAAAMIMWLVVFTTPPAIYAIIREG
jgi:uncharacterized membrane protein